MLVLHPSSSSLRPAAFTKSNDRTTRGTVLDRLQPGLHYRASYNLSDQFHSGQFEYPQVDAQVAAVLSQSPRILYFPDFLTSEECNTLIALAKGKMGRSHVASKDGRGDGGEASYRTSSQAWLDPTHYDLVRTIQRRIGEITRITQPQELIPGAWLQNAQEQMQILNYKVGQEYQAHMDYMDPAVHGPQSSQRAVTVFLYLNTVEEGGETWFPRANGAQSEGGLHVLPIKGTAVFFYDLKPSGEIDPYSMHAGCPVKKGEKGGATQWVRVKGK